MALVGVVLHWSPHTITKMNSERCLSNLSRDQNDQRVGLGCSSVVQCLARIREALDLIPSTARKKSLEDFLKHRLLDSTLEFLIK